MNILNFNNNLDLFDDEEDISNVSKIHIRIQQRNGKKSITSITGLPNDLDLKKILKMFKKTLNCNGAITDDEELGKIIQLQGDHRVFIRKFLLEDKIAIEENIIMHGF
jgi:translation initiation factor 1